MRIQIPSISICRTSSLKSIKDRGPVAHPESKLPDVFPGLHDPVRLPSLWNGDLCASSPAVGWEAGRLALTTRARSSPPVSAVYFLNRAVIARTVLVAVEGREV